MNDKDSGKYANHLVILHISDLHARQDDDYTDRLNYVRFSIPDGVWMQWSSQGISPIMERT